MLYPKYWEATSHFFTREMMWCRGALSLSPTSTVDENKSTKI